MKKLVAILGVIFSLGCNPIYKMGGTNNVVERMALQGALAAPEKIDYKVVKQMVLGPLCMKCHSEDSPMRDDDAITYSANLTSYASLFNQFTPVVVKGNPPESKLFRSVAITQSMPPAKKGYEPLDSLRIKILRLWILNCAIEDASKREGEQLFPDPEVPDKVRRCDEAPSGALLRPELPTLN